MGTQPPPPAGGTDDILATTRVARRGDGDRCGQLFQLAGHQHGVGDSSATVVPLAPIAMPMSETATQVRR
jgi:hypothetical protein